MGFKWHSDVIKTYGEDIPVLLFHPSQKLCSISSKLQSVAQPRQGAFVKRRLVVLPVRVRGNKNTIVAATNTCVLFCFSCSFTNLKNKLKSDKLASRETFKLFTDTSRTWVHKLW